jgi:DNA-binding transcriptional MocR family regulator
MIRRVPGVAIYTLLADHLRAEIQSGRLRPGDPLPGEPDLAEMHGVSRTTIRAAKAVLAAEGLIDKGNPGYPTTVLETQVFDDTRPVIKLQRGSRCWVRRATHAERLEYDLEAGARVLEVRHGAKTMVYPEDLYIFSVS